MLALAAPTVMEVVIGFIVAYAFYVGLGILIPLIIFGIIFTLFFRK